MDEKDIFSSLWEENFNFISLMVFEHRVQIKRDYSNLRFSKFNLIFIIFHVLGHISLLHTGVQSFAIKMRPHWVIAKINAATAIWKASCYTKLLPAYPGVKRVETLMPVRKESSTGNASKFLLCGLPSQGIQLAQAIIFPLLLELLSKTL